MTATGTTSRRSIRTSRCEARARNVGGSRLNVRARSGSFDTLEVSRYYVRHPDQAIGREVGGLSVARKASPSDERRRPRQRAALPAGGGTTTAVPPLLLSGSCRT